MSTSTERRHFNHERCRPKVETRGEGDDAQRVITGYAAVFYRADDPGTEYWLWDDMVERIMPGAFDTALREDDVRGCVDHREVIGRRRPGETDTTCRLSVDQIGLRYEIDCPDTQAGRDVVTLLERGDYDGSSFAFDVHGKRGKVVFQELNVGGRMISVRELHDLELADVGPVAFQAYAATTADVRQQLQAECRSAVSAREKDDPQPPAAHAACDFDMDLDLAAAQLSVLDED